MIKTKESTTISAALNASICTKLHFDNLCHAIHKLTDRTCGPSDKLIFFPADDIADTVSDNATDYEDSELEVSDEASDYDAMEMCETGGDSEKSHAVNMAMAEMMETERLGDMNPAEEDSRSSNNFPDLGAEDPPACAAGITSVVPLISSEIQIPSCPLSDVSIYDSDIFEDDDARIAEDDAFSSSCTRDNSREPTPQNDTPPFIHTDELAHIQLINPMSPWSCIAENPPNRHTVLPQWPMFFGQYNYSNSHIPWYPHIPRENFTAVHPSIHSIHKTNLQCVSQQIKREPGYDIAPSNQNSLQRSCIQGIRIELPRVIAPSPKTPSSTTSRPNPYTTPPVEESEKPTEKYSQFECLQCGGIFKERERLMEHILRYGSNPHHPNRSGDSLAPSRNPATCPICFTTISRKDNMKSHMTRHETANGPLSCGICTQKFLYAPALQRHLNWHSGQTKCAKCALDIPVTAEHRNGLGRATDFLCSNCAAIFQADDSIQSNGKFLVCYDCGQVFDGERLLYDHRRDNHGAQ